MNQNIVNWNFLIRVTMNIIDMLAIAPYYITLFFMPGNSIKCHYWYFKPSLLDIVFLAPCKLLLEEKLSK